MLGGGEMGRIGLMAERAAAASSFAHWNARSQDLRRQIQGSKAKKKGDACRQARTANTLFSVALCLLAVSGSKTEIFEHYWRRWGEDGAHGGAQSR